ncbi:MAG TPA: chemotaxis protein CheX [Kofleriaceae bacterium]|jgi:chemotaxis protein CheX|nr:chemotaxis protein CheX [Kofleriaceae bacterium]
MGELSRAIAGIVRSVCETMLGLEAELAAPGDPPDGPAGCVQFAGAWTGGVLLRCDAALARTCAAILLADDHCDDAAVCDALGELTNMVAGNLKAVLPAPSRLSLPVVVASGLPAAGAAALARGPDVELEDVHFRLPPGHRLEIAVWRDAAPCADPPDRRLPADIPG